MSRALRASVLLVLLLLVSCGGRYAAPANLDDACAIVAERPDYLREMQKAERNWGVPVYEQMAIIHQESKFIGNAKTPRKYFLWVIPAGRVSSAYGYSQALTSTWDDYRAATGHWWAERNHFGDAVDFLGWYINKTSQKLGISRTDVRDQYLAYHEGWAGYHSGSYWHKPWLIEVAGRVSSRAVTYRDQLRTCGH